MTAAALKTELEIEAPNLDALRLIADMTGDPVWRERYAESEARMRQLTNGLSMQLRAQIREGKEG